MAGKPKGDKERINTLLKLDVPTEDTDVALFSNHELRVERILLSLVRPDPIQPRRVLPERLHHRYHNEGLTPTQALNELIQVAKNKAREAGRVFGRLEELLPDVDTDEGVSYSPEEEKLRDLVSLAITIRDDGQVNPLTVVEDADTGRRSYRIETGERRYWATWLLRDFLAPDENDGAIPCIVIPAEMFSPFRQAKENTARQGLSAIAMARQAALLLLTVHEYEMPNSAVTNDFYRQALELDLRGKRDSTEQIYSAMGGIGRKRFSQYKALLRLVDEAWEIADQYNLDEKVLRLVLSLPPERQIDVVAKIAHEGLSATQVEKLLSESSSDKADKISKEKKRVYNFVRSFQKLKNTSPNEVAQELLAQEGSVESARARLKALKELVEKADSLLN